MIDSPSPAVPVPVAELSAAPPRLPRVDGWTPSRQRQFIEALASFGSVRAAAEHTGLSAAAAYKLRQQPYARAFRAAWDAAVSASRARLIDLALERCRFGVDQPVFYRGEVCGAKPVYSDKLLMFMIDRLAASDARLGGFVPAEGVRGATHDDLLGRAMTALDQLPDDENMPSTPST